MAELLLRRTNAPAAQVIYNEFIERYPSALMLSKGDRREIEGLVRRLGLNWRAQNVVQLADYFLIHEPSVPYTLEELAELPGVGPYVARAVLINCCNFSAVAVDSNVVRVVCRFFGLTESDSLRRNKGFQEMADKLILGSNARSFNYALLDFASSVCKAREPRCKGCPLAERCKSVKSD